MGWEPKTWASHSSFRFWLDEKLQLFVTQVSLETRGILMYCVYLVDLLGNGCCWGCATYPYRPNHLSCEKVEISEAWSRTCPSSKFPSKKMDRNSFCPEIWLRGKKNDNTKPKASSGRSFLPSLLLPAQPVTSVWITSIWDRIEYTITFAQQWPPWTNKNCKVQLYQLKLPIFIHSC